MEREGEVGSWDGGKEERGQRLAQLSEEWEGGEGRRGAARLMSYPLSEPSCTALIAAVHARPRPIRGS